MTQSDKDDEFQHSQQLQGLHAIFIMLVFCIFPIEIGFN